ncbi:hypothetical protein LEMLEM_LOCUS25243 [Lemmus lemmus]
MPVTIPASCRRHWSPLLLTTSVAALRCTVPTSAPTCSVPATLIARLMPARGTQVGPWPVRRTVWLTCMALSAGVTAVGDSTSRESTPVCPITWTGSMTASDHPGDQQLPPETLWTDCLQFPVYYRQ